MKTVTKVVLSYLMPRGKQCIRKGGRESEKGRKGKKVGGKEREEGREREREAGTPPFSGLM